MNGPRRSGGWRRAAVAAAAALSIIASLLASPSALQAQSSVGLQATDPSDTSLIRPVSSDDSLYSTADADRWTVCGVSKAGYIRCRGSTVYGPVRSEASDFVQVSVGNQFTCGLRSGGHLKCWAPSSSQLPRFPMFDPDGMPGSGDERAYTFKAVSTAQHQGCGLTDGRNGQTEGKLLCWSDGSVTVGSAEDKLSTVPDGDGTLSLIPAASGGDVDFTALTFSHLATGNFGNCALIAVGADAGKPRCWVSLGTTDEAHAGRAEPDVPLSAIAMGGGHAACGIVKEDTTVGGTAYTAGQVVCWGLGAKVPSTAVYKHVAIGTYHACAVNAEDKIVCWGLGSTSRGGRWDYGQLSVPAALADATFSGVYPGREFTCGILDGQGQQTAGVLTCWGEQNYTSRHPGSVAWFARGNTVAYEDRPRVAALSADADALDVSQSRSCALTAAGDAVCWGTGFRWPVPVDVKGVATGFSGTCFLRDGGDDDGKAICWGSGGGGAESGTSTSSSAMTADLSALGFSRIYAGLWHYCGIIDDKDVGDGDDTGKVRCWGFNDQGQAKAPGQTAAQNASPSRSKTITDLGTDTYLKITASYRFTCGLRTDKKIVCWGNENSPAATAHQVPAALQNKTFSDIDTGWGLQTCAIEDGQGGQIAGTLRCWGSDYTTGGVTYSLATVPAALSSQTFSKVSAGRLHNCALTTAGLAKCWGHNGYGRASVPERYENTVFVDIDAGRYHTCAVTALGGAACWGADGDLGTAGIQVGQPNGLLVNYGQADPQPPAPGNPVPRVRSGPDSESLTVSLVLVYEPVHPNAYGFGYLDEDWPGVGAGVIARLSKRVGYVVTVPLVVGGTAEAGDYWVSSPTSASPREIRVSDGINHGQMYFASCDADRDDETITVSLGDLPYPWVAGSPSSVTIRIKDSTGDCGGGASWSGTLRVDDGVRHATGLKGCDDRGWGDIDGCGLAMSSNSFAHGGRTYTIQTLVLAERLGEPDVLEMVLDREPSAALLSGTTLTVDGREFALSQATTERLTTGRWSLRWPARLHWYDGKQVALALAPTPSGGGSSGTGSTSGGGSSGTGSPSGGGSSGAGSQSSSSSSPEPTCAAELTASYGGPGGEAFAAVAVSTLQLRGGDLVDALVLNGARHGGAGGAPSGSLQLGSGEYITRVEVRHGNSIDRLAFTTNRGRTLGAGGDGGSPSTLDGIRVLRIGGRSSLYLDAIEITYCNLP